MIIDLSEWLKAERQPPAAEGASTAEPAPGDPPPPERTRAALETESFNACRHMHMSINDKQRTVKCADCKIWLDPVWCLRELFRFYEQRVDQRLLMIKQWDEQRAAELARKEERQAKPRKHKIETMQQNLERAAYNEYQSKILAARASAQRIAAGKIEAELADSDAETGA